MRGCLKAKTLEKTIRNEESRNGIITDKQIPKVGRNFENSSELKKDEIFSGDYDFFRTSLWSARLVTFVAQDKSNALHGEWNKTNYEL